ncbi:MAG: hypothetical protein JHC26_12800 [Thermofilum sp.]|uniref:hypothetical protein n=1 Tax=Thermofilum sp. TaxID=1961369 RepID=UPI00258FBE6F|nr:hypothetical protein [Thermofilum sp.]MCI4409965.1 hypothetical protein [Thermofilum sp.]
MGDKPNGNVHVMAYPESRLVYKEMLDVKTEVFLPEYVVKAVKERAEALEANVSVRVWWPYLYIFIEKDIGKEVDDCYDIAWSKTESDAMSDCDEKCGENEECRDKCIDVWKYETYKSCLEDIGDDIRPSIAKTTQELEDIFKLYGIEADIETEWYHDVVEIRIRLKGYNELVPMEIGKNLLAHIVEASMAKTYTDIEMLTYKIVRPLIRYYNVEGFIKLVQNVDKNKIYISRMYDKYDNVRKYEITVEYNDDKIRFLITEEKGKKDWEIIDIMMISVLSPVADLTPA